MSERDASLLQPCADLDEAVAFFRDRLGLRLESIFPADSPTWAVVAGRGLSIRLDLTCDAPPATIVVPRRAADGDGDGDAVVGPNGTTLRFEAPRELPDPRPSLSLTRADPGDWKRGRAGMLYRDLVPDRQGGRFIASHIRIPAGGPVPDYVHHHDVRLQMIYCWRGRVRVVYEDQGAPFWLEAGDCVLQPPHIRHRVLETSAGLDVIEISSPALHETHVDHAMELPTGRDEPGRDFSGQRFVRHVAAAHAGAARDLGIAPATGGLASARVLTLPEAAPDGFPHEGEFYALFVLGGGAHVAAGDRRESLAAGDFLTVPAGMPFVVTAADAGTELLEIAVPAR